MSIFGTRRWVRVRAWVLARDHHRCKMTRDGHICGAVATTVQHVVRREHGGTDDVSNLIAACTGCNYGERVCLTTAPPARLSPAALVVVAALDAAGAATTVGRRRAAPVLAAAHPGRRFAIGDIDAACRWRRHRGPLGRL